MKIVTSEGHLQFNHDAVILSDDGEKLLDIKMEKSQGPCVLSVKTSSADQITLAQGERQLLAENLLIRPKMDNVIHVIRPTRKQG